MLLLKARPSQKNYKFNSFIYFVHIFKYKRKDEAYKEVEILIELNQILFLFSWSASKVLDVYSNWTF